MKGDLGRKNPVNIRTVLFCFCASGAISVPLAFGFQAFGYSSPDIPGTEFIPRIALFEIIMLPLVALSLMRVERFLTKFGLFIFLITLLCALFPATA